MIGDMWITTLGIAGIECGKKGSVEVKCSLCCCFYPISCALKLDCQSSNSHFRFDCWMTLVSLELKIGIFQVLNIGYAI